MRFYSFVLLQLNQTHNCLSTKSFTQVWKKCESTKQKRVKVVTHTVLVTAFTLSQGAHQVVQVCFDFQHDQVEFSVIDDNHTRATVVAANFVKPTDKPLKHATRFASVVQTCRNKIAFLFQQSLYWKVHFNRILQSFYTAFPCSQVIHMKLF